jgi:hypothetical protein
MLARNGRSANPPPLPTIVASYQHVLSTGVFHVAEAEGRIAAIAGAIVRDDLWHLSAFWARPSLQRQGIGMPLLRSVRDAGKEAGATTFFTWSSVDPTAMASYMKLGMYPGYPILSFGGPPKRVPNPAPGYEVAPLERARAMALDQGIRGTRRPLDHDYWGGRPSVRGRQVLRAGEVVGYYYIGAGSVGPAGWRRPEDGAAVLALAFREAVETSQEIRLAVPGINHLAIRFALDSGLRLGSFSHFLTTAQFGRIEQYIPSGPGLY